MRPMLLDMVAATALEQIFPIVEKMRRTLSQVYAKRSKYWPPVGRIDNVHGDKNLICACVPTSDYE